MAKGIKALIFLITILLVLMPAAQAVGAATVRYEFDYTPSTTMTLNYWAVNSGNSTQNYVIRKDGDLVDYITLYVDEVTVPPTSVKKFKINITHPDYLAPGNYSSIISVLRCNENGSICKGVILPLLVYASDKIEVQETAEEVQKPRNIFSAIVQKISFARLSITRKSTNIIAVIPTNPTNTMNLIERVNEDSRVKAIILEIKSHENIQELSSKIEDIQKPVVVLIPEKSSFTELAFLSTADKLVAPSTAVIGTEKLFKDKYYWTATEAKEIELVDGLGEKQKAKELAEEVAEVSESKLINFGEFF